MNWQASLLERDLHVDVSIEAYVFGENLMVIPDCSPTRVATLEDEVRNLQGCLSEPSNAVQEYLDDASKTDDLDQALEHAKKALRNSPVMTAKQTP